MPFNPQILQLAIICNQESSLAQSGLDGLVVLDPRTNDRSLVMTGSFSNLVLAGVSAGSAGEQPPEKRGSWPARRPSALLPAIEKQCERIAARVRNHCIVVLFIVSPCWGWGSKEAGLKITGNDRRARFPVVSEERPPLGLRHGPMSFLRRRYACPVPALERSRAPPLRDRPHPGASLEEAWIFRGHRRRGRARRLFDDVIPAVLPEAPDDMRTPFEILIPQLLGYHLSRSLGLNPDNPSPNGVISRVVQGVTIHAGLKE